MSDREDEYRQRDENARDRDEQARNRDELSRDRDAFSQRATRAARNVQTWATVVVIVMVAGLFYVIQVRADAIEEIQSSAHRIEEAATHTEEVLIEVVDARSTPEAIAQNEAVRRAIEDIAAVRRMLCSLPQLQADEACQE